jgi:hypothetical protein
LLNRDSFIYVKFKNTFTSGTIGVKAQNACGASAIKTVSITKLTAATPSSIQKSFTPSVAAITNVAGMTTDTLRIRKVVNAIQYQWSLKLNSNATIEHLSADDNDTAIVVHLSNGFTKDTVLVSTVSYCNISASNSIVLSALAIPPTVNSIVGDRNVCKNNTYTFTASASLPSVTQAPVMKYRWVIPATASFDPTYTYPSDSSTIRIILGSNFNGGSLSVKAVSAVNVLSATSYVVSLKSGVAAPSNIISSTSNYFGCIGSSINYTVSMPALTSTQQVSSVYRWTIPRNTSITSANSDSSSITLLFGAGYAGGSLTVKSQNSCGIQSSALSKTLSFSVYPKTPVSITSSTNNYAGCKGGSIDYTVTDTTHLSGLTYLWTIPANTTITSATTDSSRITLLFGSGYTGGILSVRNKTSCGAIGTAKTVTLLAPYSTPAPTAILSNSGYYACVGNNKVFTVQMAAPTGTQQMARTYLWTLPNNTSIISDKLDSSIITLHFNTCYTGGNIAVRGISSCG